jgi:small subunit ribosomal protein S3Ae
MAQKTTAKDLKKKKKKWLTILASKEFGSQEIGETFIEDPNQTIGRTIRVNLMDLTKDPKRQNFNILFKIIEIKNNQALTKMISYNIQVAQLKKITKKNKNKVEDSQEYTAKDGKKVTIKPILITKSLAYKSSLKQIRQNIRALLEKYVKENDSEKILKDIMMGGLQKDLKNNAKKVLPIVACLIKNASLKE